MSVMTYKQMARKIKELCGDQSIPYYNFLGFKYDRPDSAAYAYKTMLEIELYFAEEELEQAQKKVDKAKQLLGEIAD